MHMHIHVYVNLVRQVVKCAFEIGSCYMRAHKNTLTHMEEWMGARCISGDNTYMKHELKTDYVVLMNTLVPSI